MSWVDEVFGVKKPVIGMLHLLPLPSAPRYDAVGGMGQISDAARRDVEALQRGGIDGIMFCNEHDRPYTLDADPAVIAAMSFVIGALSAEISVPLGVDVLWDPRAAIAVAGACGGKFVREILSGAYASDMGLWNTDVGGVMRYRHQVSADHVRVLFNINAEFAAPLAPRPLEEVTRSVAFSSVPDGICVSGQMTGEPVNAASLKAVKCAAGEVSVFINTGARLENIRQLLPLADGVIVGSSLKYGGRTWNAVDAERVKAFMEAVHEVRGE